MAGQRTVQVLYQTIADLSGANALIKGQELMKKALDKSNVSFSKNNEIISSFSRVIKEKGGKPVVELVNKYKTLDGTTKTVTGRFQRLRGELVPVANSLNIVSRSTSGLNSANTSVIGSLGKIVSRAIPTIIVWQTLRKAMQAVAASIGLVVKELASLDRAVTEGFSVVDEVEKTERNFGRLRDIIKELTSATGQSTKNVGQVFLELKRAGLGLEESFEATKTATQLSAGAFVDNKEAALALVDSYKLMGDSIRATAGEQDQFNFLAGLAIKLADKNATSVEGLIRGFRVFAPFANTLGLTIQQTLSLVASLNDLGIRGNEAGTVLTRAFIFMQKNAETTQKILGRFLSGDEFQDFIDLTKALKQLPEGQSKTLIEEIFGTKAIKGPAALAKSIETLNKNIDITTEASLNLEDTIGLVSARSAEVTNNIEVLGEKNKQVFSQIGQEIFTIVTGFEDFKGALEGINNVLNSVLDNLRKFREFRNETGEGLTGVLSSFVSGGGGAVGAANALLKIRSNASRKSSIDAGRSQADQFKAGLGPLGQVTSTDEGALKASKETNKALDETLEKSEKVNETFEKRVILAGDPIIGEIEAMNQEIRNAEVGMERQVELANALEAQIKKIVDQNNEYAKNSLTKNIPLLTEQQVLTALISGNQKELIENSKLEVEDVKKLTKLYQQSYEARLSKEKEISQLRLQERFSEIEFLRNFGASEEQLHQLRMQALTEEKATKEELRAEELRHLDKMRERTTQLGQQISDSLQSGLEGLLKNEKTLDEFFTDFGNNLQNAIVKSVAKGLTSTIAKSGVFGQLGGALGGIEDVFATGGNPIATAHADGGRIAAQRILQAHTQGAQILASATSGSATAGATAGSGQGGAGGILGGLGGFIGPAVGAFSGFQAGRQRGGLQAALGGAGGFLSAGGGALLGLAGPVGLAIGAGLTIASLFGGSKKTTTTETTEQTQQIASRIDVTNSQLQVLNRTMFGLRQDLTFIMQETAFFSEKRVTLEDEFAIDSNRGVV